MIDIQCGRDQKLFMIEIFAFVFLKNISSGVEASKIHSSHQDRRKNTSALCEQIFRHQKIIKSGLAAYQNGNLLLTECFLKACASKNANGR